MERPIIRRSIIAIELDGCLCVKQPGGGGGGAYTSVYNKLARSDNIRYNKRK
jgi:hypothetical protein